MNTIRILCNENGELKFTGRLDINQFSSNTTEFEITFPSFTKEHSKYLETITPDGIRNKTAINLNGGNIIETYLIPYELLKQQGRLQIQITTSIGEDTVYVSDRFNIAINKSIGADNTILIEYKNIIQQLTDDLNTEIQEREGEDLLLQSNITTEAAIRAAADLNLQSNINIEISAREVAYNTLEDAFLSEESSRAAQDITLQTNINAESLARTNADTTLQANLTTETIARVNTDEVLQTAIDLEVSTRTSEDALKIDKTSITDNLITDDVTKVLSAKQGKTLKTSVDSKEPKITAGTNLEFFRGDKTLASFSNTVRYSGLVGFIVGANTPITGEDFVLSGFGKLQGQINAMNTTVGDINTILDAINGEVI